jgi:ligand-binding sensor domain-containing protein
LNDKSLSKQQAYFPDRSSLRALFREFLEPGEEEQELKWETITTKEGLPHNWIYDLFQDSKGRIWVGTWGGGLARFDADQWTIFTAKNGLHCNEVTCIREDTRGELWVATDRGLNKFDGEQIVDAGLEGKSLLNITFDQKGNLWAGCWRSVSTGGGLYRFNGQKWELFTTRSNLPGLEILKVFKDSKDRIWVGTYEHGIGAGVGRYDGKNWVSFTHRDGLVDDCVYSMFEDPKGNIWFGTVGGVSIFDGSNWHTVTTKDGLVDNRVYSMMIDRQKKMWFGTEGGISRFDGERWISYTQKDGLVENLVRSMVETTDGSLWFGTYPYQRGRGGISIARSQGPLSLPDRIVKFLPETPQQKRLGSGGSDQGDEAK